MELVRSVQDEVGRPLAVIAVVATAEVGSCAGYLLVFRSTFCSQMSWRLSYDIAMAELAANSLLPAAGAGGLALGVWALRQAGMPTGHVARRTVAFFVVTSAANFFTLVVVGIGVFAGILAGPGGATLTLVPALITAFGAVMVGLSPAILRALGERGAHADRHSWSGRARLTLRAWLAAAADGVEQAVELLRSRSLGGILDPTWLDLYSQAVRTVTGQSQPRDFIGRRASPSIDCAGSPGTR